MKILANPLVLLHYIARIYSSIASTFSFCKLVKEAGRAEHIKKEKTFESFSYAHDVYT